MADEENIRNIFDKIANLKSYFPDGNISNILLTLNRFNLAKKHVKYRTHLKLKKHFENKVSKSDENEHPLILKKNSVVNSLKRLKTITIFPIPEIEIKSPDRLQNIFLENTENQSLFSKNNTFSFYDIVYEVLSNEELRKKLFDEKDKVLKKKKN